MTNDNQPTSCSEQPRITFGTRLKSTREARGLKHKDIATQLRLNEKVILMLETEHYPQDLPLTFIHGYMRAYAKLLNLPEQEVKDAINVLSPKSIPPEIVTPTKPTQIVTSGHYFMQFFTYLIVVTLVGLVGMWWYSHPSTPSPLIAENRMPIAPEGANALSLSLASNLANAIQTASSASQSLGSQVMTQTVKVAIAKSAHSKSLAMLKRKVIPVDNDDDDDDDR